jgi:hypothetical protein
MYRYLIKVSGASHICHAMHNVSLSNQSIWCKSHLPRDAHCIVIYSAQQHPVPQLVGALCFEPEGRGFDSLGSIWTTMMYRADTF